MTMNNKVNVIFASLGTVFVDGISVFISIHEQSTLDFFVLCNS